MPYNKREIMTIAMKMTALSFLSAALMTGTPCLAQTDANKTACALLEGGEVPSMASNPDLHSRWFVIDRAVSQGSKNSLVAKGYKIEDDIVDIRDANSRIGHIVQQLKSTGCTKVVQISAALKDSPATPGIVSQFTFTALVFHLEQKSPREVFVAGEFQKDYSFPLTTDTMDHLSLSGVGEKIAADIDASATLEKNK
jgi:hypothetical protein